jgi:hypothetical protein
MEYPIEITLKNSTWEERIVDVSFFGKSLPVLSASIEQIAAHDAVLTVKIPMRRVNIVLENEHANSTDSPNL